MACAHTWLMPNKNYNPSVGNTYFNQKYFKVPCGHCLCCIADRKQRYKHEALYEAKQSGADNICFVTLTYSERSVMEMDCIPTFNGSPLLDSEGHLVYSCRFKHFQDFMKRLRIQTYRKYGDKLNVKYMMCQEYGDDFGRCHFHILFFGLNVSHTKLIEDAWRHKDGELIGKVQVEQLSDLGKTINYISKYMDKSTPTSTNKQLYDYKGIERPRVVRSKGFGIGLYTSQLDYIRTHNMCYRFYTDEQDYPVPISVRNKLLGRMIPDNTQTIEKMKAVKYPMKGNRYTSEDIDNFRRANAQNREEKLVRMQHQKHIPTFEVDYNDIWKYI